MRYFTVYYKCQIPRHSRISVKLTGSKVMMAWHHFKYLTYDELLIARQISAINQNRKHNVCHFYAFCHSLFLHCHVADVIEDSSSIQSNKHGTFTLRKLRSSYTIAVTYVGVFVFSEFTQTFNDFIFICNV